MLLTVHQSNAPFPVTRHQFRMMCDKDILQLLFEDLNQSVSPANQLPIYKLSNSQLLQQTSSMCRLSAIKTCSTGTSWPLKVGPIGYPKTLEQNYHFMLRTVPEDSSSQNVFNFSVHFHQENTKWWNINVFCDITLENIYWGKITWSPRSRKLVPLSLLNISVVGSKVSSSLKTTGHDVFSFRYHINKIHTQISSSLL